MLPAAMKLQIVVHGNAVERALCPPCGQKYSGLASAPLMPSMPFALLSGLMAPAQGAPTLPGPARCGQCGYPFQQYQHTSMLGCAECYTTFAPQMQVILRRAQGGSVQHTGKTPTRGAGTYKQRRAIETLRGELESAVKEQRFEEAAQLRDRIRDLEKELADDASSR